ncbi:MAG: hypothetical protein JXA90_12275 [Planctomycetes bacterium]|nr:hypothetical protein [Planctomycetota bacterium]
MTALRSARLAAVLVLGLEVASTPLAARPGDLIGYLPFSTVAPQDIAIDPADGTFWVSNFLLSSVHHYSSDLRAELDVFQSPFGASSFLTGIAFNTIDDTLLLVEPASGEIAEVFRDGTPTGRTIQIPLEPVVNPNGAPTARGLTFHRGGNGGQGSIFVVEALGTLIYEITLGGELIRYFPHPEDPDGYPGEGSSAQASDIDLIYDGEDLTGFYVTGTRGTEWRLLRLDREGNFTGIAVSLGDAGGNVSGVLRREFADPRDGRIRDSYVCVVESNARFAVLEGGEPTFREIFEFECRESGREVRLSWTSRQVYDAIEILEGCEVQEVLPGDATEWSAAFETDGVYEFSVRAVREGDSFETAACTVVIGPGQVIASRRLDIAYPIDIAWDGSAFLLLSDALGNRIVLLDLDMNVLGEILVGAPLLDESELITGVARGLDADAFFVYNTSRHVVGELNYSGEVTGMFEAQLPDLQEDPEEDPFLGTVIGMALDPGGDGERGSLWLLEGSRDFIYEIDLSGRLLRDIPHPYREIDRTRPDIPYGSYSSGISLVEGSDPLRLFLTGGTLREFRQPRIFELDAVSGSLLGGTEFPTDAIRREAANGTMTLAHVLDHGRSRLFVLPLLGSSSRLLEVEPPPIAVPEPTMLRCRQTGYADDVELRFQNNGPYDSVEVFRDCRLVAELPGEARSFVDADVDPGLREYSVRGVIGGRASGAAACRLRVGVGALLEREFLWPARSPQQLTRDPLDGSLYVAVSWPGDERKLYHFDAGFRFIGERESVLESPWEIAAVAARRAPPGDLLLNYIGWQQPIPVGQAGHERFLLATENAWGEKVYEVEIDPPRPTNGFVTYPTGLVWEPGSDTFFFLERNSRQFVQMAPDGTILRVLPHPDPPFQNFVFNLGVAFSPQRETLFITGAGRQEHRVTKVMEMTLDGVLTGHEISVAELEPRVTGIAISGRDLIAVGSHSVADILRLEAFPGMPPPFIRGDANRDEVVDLADAVFTLNYLFLGGDRPSYADAADADDDGRVSITDAVVVLRHLFLAGDPPPPPYPSPGQDPTPDGLPCEEGIEALRRGAASPR